MGATKNVIFIHNAYLSHITHIASKKRDVCFAQKIAHLSAFACAINA
jgi:hypothetical protein